MDFESNKNKKENNPRRRGYQGGAGFRLCGGRLFYITP
jgi:hypothetical protein